LLESLLLAAERPLSPEAVEALVNEAVDEEEWPERTDARQIAVALARLAKRWATDGRGIEIVEVAGGWRLRTPEALAPMVRRLWPARTPRLSPAALEALSIVAYRQPCTRLDVDDVRGVDSGGVLRSLLERRLIKIVGRKDEPGRPILYGTTSEFLETFSLTSLKALPTLRDLEQMRAEEAARSAGELAQGSLPLGVGAEAGTGAQEAADPPESPASPDPTDPG
jgi:segregation and condensation protein B